jgi:hypothetical protein
VCGQEKPRLKLAGEKTTGAVEVMGGNLSIVHGSGMATPRKVWTPGDEIMLGRGVTSVK